MQKPYQACWFTDEERWLISRRHTVHCPPSTPSPTSQPTEALTHTALSVRQDPALLLPYILYCEHNWIHSHKAEMRMMMIIAALVSIWGCVIDKIVLSTCTYSNVITIWIIYHINVLHFAVLIERNQGRNAVWIICKHVKVNGPL